MQNKSFLRNIVLIIFILCSCAKPKNDEAISASTKYLYIASGMCQAGANGTFSTTTSSNLISRVDLNNSSSTTILADYNILPAYPGDSPVGIAPYDSSRIVALIERSGARRMELVPKQALGTRQIFSNDATTAFIYTLLGLTKTPSGSYVATRTNGMTEILPSGLTQIPTFATNNPGGACGTNNKYSSVTATTNGHIFFTNSYASNNRIGIIKSSGSTCLASMTAPVATAYPTTSVFIPGADQVIVAYAGNSVATDINSLYVYPITEDATTASIGTGTKIYDANGYPGTYSYLLYAVSAMAYDATDNSLYIATAITSSTTVVQYQIYKFTYDSTTPSLTLVSSTPFVTFGSGTRCISSMFIDN